MADALLSPQEFFGSGAPAPSTDLLSPEQFFGGPATVAKPAEESTLPQTGIAPVDAFNNFTQQAGRAATFGLSDKVGAVVPALNEEIGRILHDVGTGQAQAQIGAAGGGVNRPAPSPVAAPTISDIYHQELARQRAAGETYAKNHPVASKAATTIGTLLSIPLTGSPEAALDGVGARVAQGVKQGATIGGLTGFGESNDESLGKTAIDTATGAGTGATVGGVVPIAGEYLAKPAFNAFMRSPLGQWMATKFGSDVMQNQAVQQIADRMRQDQHAGGPTAQDMMDLINATPNKPLMIADVAGENVKNRVGSLARQPGPARELVASALNERDKGAGTRLAGDVNTHISNGGSAFNTAQALEEARATAAAPLYEKAFAANQNIQSPVIDRILKTPAGQKALAAARVKMQNDLSLMGTPDKDLMEQAREAGQKIPGGKGVASGLKLRTLDYVKRAFDDMIGASLKAGENDNARILIARKNQLVKALDDADVTGKAGPNSLKPEGGLYAQARAAYSGPSQSLGALEDGRKIFTKSPEQIEAEIDDLSPGDKEFYKLGAADAIKERVAKTGMAGDEAKRIVNTDWAQRQIRPLFDSDEAYKSFIDSAVAENRMFETRFNTLKGAHTAGRVAEDASENKGAAANAVQMAIDAAHGNVPGALYAGARTVGSIFGRPHGNPEVNLAAAKMLTSTDRDANLALLARILAGQGAPGRTPIATIPLAATAANAVPSIMRGGYLPGRSGQ